MNRKLLQICMMVFMISSLVIYGCSTKESKFPSGKQIDLIVTWPAGGGTDLAARAIAQPASKVLGQTINIVNITGGGGAIGYQQASRKAADGYTLLAMQFDILTVTAQGLAPVSYKDFDPIMMFAEQPVTFIVPKASPWKTLGDFIKAAKKKPNYNIGGASIGGINHQAAQLACNSMGVKINYVPYAGNAELLPQLLGNHADGAFCMLTGIEQQLRIGDLRLLGVLAPKRLEAYPDAPTLKELGYDVEYAGFYGIGVPKGVSEDKKAVLKEAFTTAYKNPDFASLLQKMDLLLTYKDSKEFEGYLANMYPKVADVVKIIVKKKTP